MLKVKLFEKNMLCLPKSCLGRPTVTEARESLAASPDPIFDKSLIVVFKFSYFHKAVKGGFLFDFPYKASLT